MQFKATLTLCTVSVLLAATDMVAGATSQAAEFMLFAPLNASPLVNTWISSDTRPIKLAQSQDAFPPLGFDPSQPENSRPNPERAPVWPVSPTDPEPPKPLKIEPMKLLQAPKPLPKASPSARPAYQPPPPSTLYPAVPQPGAAAYGYGYPQPPGYNPQQTGRNPWAQGNRNSWMKAGNNSWNNAGRNSWSNTGRNAVTNKRRNPWAAPNSAVNRPPNNNWGRNPYYGQRQPVFAPRHRNPWETDARPSVNGGYASQFPPLYRRGENTAKAKTAPRTATGVYPNYNWGAPAPWYGPAPGIR